VNIKVGWLKVLGAIPYARYKAEPNGFGDDELEYAVDVDREGLNKYAVRKKRNLEK
jgi:hypothetical protein